MNGLVKSLIAVILFPVPQHVSISPHNLYTWIKKYGPESSTNNDLAEVSLTEGAEAVYRRKGHIKKSSGVLRKAIRLSSPLFVTTPIAGMSVSTVGCWMFIPVISSAAAFLTLPGRSETDGTGQTVQLESGCVYGYCKIHLDLRDRGISAE